MRVKRGVAHVKRRKNILQATKGYKWGRKNQLRKSKTAATRAGRHAYKHRRLKKRDMRATWQVRINAGARQHGLSYSKFIFQLRQKHVEVDRKMLSLLAAEHPETFAALVKAVQ